MTTPRVIDCSLAEYIADSFHDGPPSLSASVAHLLLTRSPAHARYAHPRLNPDWRPDEDSQTDAGTIAHALLLERAEDRAAVLLYDNYQTKVARAERASARLAGRIPILFHQMAEIRVMVESARAAIHASELRDVFSDAERTLLWQENGVWCRARPDWMSRDRRVLGDFKTTRASAEPDAFGRTILSMGYDLQAALAVRGARACFDVESVFVFVVVECEPPYATSFVGLSPAFLAFADRKVERALGIWRECLAPDRWPGYPSRIAYLEPPAWAEYAEGMRTAMIPLDDGRPLDEQLFGEEAT